MKFSKSIFALTASFSFLIWPNLNDMIIHSTNQFNGNMGYNNSSMVTNGEYNVIKKLIKPHDVIFDIGANRGEWSSAVLSIVSNIDKIYAFEPIPVIFNVLSEKMLNKPIKAYELALSDVNGMRDFLLYSQNEQVSELSSFYSRPILYNLLGIKPKIITVKSATLDKFCCEKNIKHIDFLKIDTEGSELAVLKGAQAFLKNKAIQHIQFEYGGTYTDAGTTLKQVMSLLTSCEYVIFRIFSKGLIHIASWDDSLENYAYSNYVAVLKENAYQFSLIDNL